LDARQARAEQEARPVDTGFQGVWTRMKNWFSGHF
jgi:cell division protein FtsA